MKQSTATNDPAGTRRARRGGPITVLSGLPGPVRVAVAVVIAVVVGFASLSQVGILAPQFRNTGGGSAGSGVPGGIPPGTPPGWTVPTNALSGWVVLRNISWRGWEVTAVDVPHESGLDVVAFLPPAGEWIGPILSRAAPLPPSQLPVTVARGGDLVVFTTKRPGACALPGPPNGRPPKVRATVHMSSPLGDRSVDATMFVDPAPPCSA
ncbi:MAG: hypothetical protein M3137_18045 [Actinomycetota bacterium]|nr:hypothetical protein [Actinomycetota bacterium]